MNTPIRFPISVSAVRHPRAGFESIPRDLSKAELFRYFTYSEKDLQEINLCRGVNNKIGFSLLLSGVRLTGRFPHDLELIPHSVLIHISEQLRVPPPLFIDYPQRRPTRHEHTERLRAYLGLRSFTHQDQAMVNSLVSERVRAGARLHELLPAMEQKLREQYLVLPGVTTLEKLIGRELRDIEPENVCHLRAEKRFDRRRRDDRVPLVSGHGAGRDQHEAHGSSQDSPPRGHHESSAPRGPSLKSRPQRSP